MYYLFPITFPSLIVYGLVGLILYSRKFIVLPIALFGAATIIVFDILQLFDRTFPLMFNAAVLGVTADAILKYSRVSSATTRLLVAIGVLILVVILGVAGKIYILPINRLLYI